MERFWTMLEAIGTIVLAGVAVAVWLLYRRKTKREIDSRFRPFPVITSCVLQPKGRYQRYRQGGEQPEGAHWPTLTETELRELKEGRSKIYLANFRGSRCVVVNALPPDHDMAHLVLDFAVAEVTVSNCGYPACEIELLGEEVCLAGKTPERVTGTHTQLFTMLQTDVEQTVLLCLASDPASDRATRLLPEATGCDCLNEADVPQLKGRLPYARVGVDVRLSTLLGDHYDYTLSIEQQNGFFMARTREIERDSFRKKLRRKAHAFLTTK